MMKSSIFKAIAAVPVIILMISMAPPKNEGGEDLISIKQGTVGTLNSGVRVGCSVIFKDIYILPDGSEKKGTTALLKLWNERDPLEVSGCPVKVEEEEGNKIVSIEVGPGSEFTVNGETYRVEDVLERRIGNFFNLLFHLGASGGHKDEVIFYRIEP